MKATSGQHHRGLATAGTWAGQFGLWFTGHLRGRGLLAAALVALGLSAIGLPAMAEDITPQTLRCGGALKQGGLVICRAPSGATIEIGGVSRRVADHGVVTHGLSRDAPAIVTVRLLAGTSADGPPDETLSLPIETRTDPVRRIEGMECDKVDARTDAQKAHAARSWTTKVEAFARFDTATPPAEAFRLPADGKPTSPFGPVRTYVGVSAETGEPCEKQSVHQGYDIAAPVGTPVMAPAGGTVILAEPDLYYEGGTVFLDHGGGLVSVFMHMSEVTVMNGQTVMAGDPLGAVGNTGRTTGPHLHWAVKWRDEARGDRSADRYIDPELLLAIPAGAWSGTG